MGGSQRLVVGGFRCRLVSTGRAGPGRARYSEARTGEVERHRSHDNVHPPVCMHPLACPRTPRTVKGSDPRTG